MSICHLTDAENCDQERKGYITGHETIDMADHFDGEATSTMTLMTSGMVNVNCPIVSSDEMNCHLSTKIQQDLKLSRGENQLVCCILTVREIFNCRFIIGIS